MKRDHFRERLRVRSQRRQTQFREEIHVLPGKRMGGCMAINDMMRKQQTKKAEGKICKTIRKNFQAQGKITGRI